MTGEFLLTIGIPVYNSKDGLSATLGSLAGLRNISENAKTEILVSDNCSDDDTSEYLKTVRSENPGISIYRNEVNEGYDANIDLIMTRARGRYVWLLGAGERIEPGALPEILNMLKAEEFDNLLLNFRIFSEEKGMLETGNGFPAGDDRTFSSPAEFFGATNTGITAMSANIVNRAKWLGILNNGLKVSGWGHVERILMILAGANYKRSRFIGKACFTLYREKSGWWSRNGNLLLNTLKLYDILNAPVYRASLGTGCLTRSIEGDLWKIVLQSKMNGLNADMRLLLASIRRFGSGLRFWLLTFPVLLIPKKLLSNRVVSRLAGTIKKVINL